MSRILKDPEKILAALEMYTYEKQLTQTELAKRLGVSLPAVNGWLLGKREPRRFILYRIQKFLQKEGFLK